MPTFSNTLKKLEHIPFWPSLQELFDLNFESATCDSADSNLKCERSLSQDRANFLRLLCRCQVHILSGIQGRIYAPCASTISGIIALALTLKPAGAVLRLRQALQRVITSSVNIVRASPPGAGDQRRVHRDHLLDLCLSDSARNLQRRCMLSKLLTGSNTGSHRLAY